MSEYLMPNQENCSIEERRRIFEIRNRILPIPAIFHLNKNVENCWGGEDEDMKHIYVCEYWISEKDLFLSSYKQLLAMEYQNTCSSSQMTSQFRHTFISENMHLWNRKSIKISFRVTRTLFAFAEMTNMDPGYAGPEFDFDKIINELRSKVKRI